MKKIAVVGAGGFAREVAWLIREINDVHPTYQFAGYLVSDLSRLGEQDSRDQVIGDFTWLREHRADVDCLALGIGTPAAKGKVTAQLDEIVPDMEWPAIVHPSARYDRSSSKVARGVVICAGVIGTVNLTFEEFAMVNLSCTIGHESVIGRCAVLNPTVNISGGVTIGENALIGTGAQVLQYLEVGAGATVGGGSVVTKSVPAGVTVVGIPAKPLQPRT